MNPEVKKKWVKALRSGKYKQTMGCLHDKFGYCCLGVLCDLHAKETKGSWDENNYKRQRDLLPAEVCIWAGLPFNRKKILITGTDVAVGETTLSEINDWPRSFEEIADRIETVL